MNEHPYDPKHLQEYTGILTSPDARGEEFKMELKAEDNPVMERWTQKEKSTIEVEFRYNLGPSTMFFHNWQTCPNYLNQVDCNNCTEMRVRYDIFKKELFRLQFGDTFKIKAALINNDQSVLPAEIHSFENYQPLLAACTTDAIRLPDTPEGIQKKYEREQQRLIEEHEAEEKRKADEAQARKDAKWENIKETLQQIFGEGPYSITIIGTAIGSVLAGIIFGALVEPIPRLFQSIYFLISSLIFPN